MSRERIARAPGRVNLIGDHTDYNEGFVLPVAIDLECTVRARARGDEVVRVQSLDLGSSVELSGGDPRTVEPEWGRYVAGSSSGPRPPSR